MGFDSSGNIALGFSRSSSTEDPSIAYVGRTPGDLLNTLPQPETTLVSGGGYVNDGTPFFGDYSQMTVDPVDDCTFWYANEYYANQTEGNADEFRTRISSFRYPTCTPDLSVAQQDTQGSSGQVSVAVTMTNSGTGPATGLTLDDFITSSVGFSVGISSASPGVSCVPAPPPKGYSGKAVCTLSTLPAGGQANVTFSFQGTSGGTLTNTLRLAANQSDPDPGNNVSYATITYP
jgi:hypothetical protein